MTNLEVLSLTLIGIGLGSILTAIHVYLEE